MKIQYIAAYYIYVIFVERSLIKLASAFDPIAEHEIMFFFINRKQPAYFRNKGKMAATTYSYMDLIENMV